jgi:hypothetical protein
MHQQTHAIDKFTRAGATVGLRFVKLVKQFAKRGEFHSPVSFVKFIPRVAGRVKPRNVPTDVGGQVPEDRMVGFSFAFTEALESLDLHLEAGFNGSLPQRPVEVGFHQGADVRGNGLDIL